MSTIYSDVWYYRKVDKTMIYLPPELRRALADHARRVQRPQAEIICEAIAAYVGAAPRTKNDFRWSGRGQSFGRSFERKLPARAFRKDMITLDTSATPF